MKEEEREGKGRTLFIVFGWKVEGVEGRLGRQSVGQPANYTTICKAKGESGGNGVGRTDWQAGKGGREGVTVNLAVPPQQLFSVHWRC